MTMVPPLEVASVACDTTSAVSSSTVMMVLSAPTPRVSCVTSSSASSAVAAVCVAPKRFALSRLSGAGSTAIRCCAPA